MITKQQKSTLLKHSQHHTKKHMSLMRKLMKQGRSFTQSHKIAQKKVGS